MLQSSNSLLRVVGAVTAVLHRFPEGSDPPKIDVATSLIHGLSDGSVNVRATAYSAFDSSEIQAVATFASMPHSLMIKEPQLSGSGRSG